MFQQGNGHLQFILFHLCVQSLSAGIVAYLRLVSRHFLQCESRGIAIDPWTMCTDLDQLSVARVVALCFWPYPYPELQTVTHFSIGVIMLSKPYKYWDEAIRLQIIRCVLVSRNLDLERILICWVPCNSIANVVLNKYKTLFILIHCHLQALSLRNNVSNDKFFKIVGMHL